MEVQELEQSAFTNLRIREEVNYSKYLKYLTKVGV